MSVLLLIEKIRKKCILIYRKNLFRAITGNDVSSLKILGRIDVVNKNVKIGKNVTLFNGVTLFGDGEIVIGDRVSIGENTIIYSSRAGGGKNWFQCTNCCAELYY